MTRPHYERLSALDAAMLFMETDHTHMHIGAVVIVEDGPLAVGGGIDVDRIREHIAGGLDQTPRHRQRLAFIPIERHPVWVDDGSFDLDYHVRHTVLPWPGTMEQLKQFVSRVMSQKLDLTRPPWEVWIVEGLSGGRFALVYKLHHCVADGVGAINVLSIFFSPDAQGPAWSRSTWRPRPAPSPVELTMGELQRRARAPSALARSLSAALQYPEDAVAAVRETFEGAVEAVVGKLEPASSTALNVDEVGPNRRFECARIDLNAVKEVKSWLGGKVNDVVLATVAGAVRRYLQAHRKPVNGLDFRVVLPVNLRPAVAACDLGNRVVPTLAPLPLGIGDPCGRLCAVAEATQALKASQQVRAIELFEEMCNWAPARLIAAVVRRATRFWAGNLIVTNIPGPQLPLYLLGARLVECYPFVPMMANQALNIAVLSYDGGLHWGFNADGDALSDLPALVDCVGAEFAELEEAASKAAYARGRRAAGGG